MLITAFHRTLDKALTSVLQDIIDMQRVLDSEYGNWKRHAPADSPWEFFKAYEPVVITCKYGQNLPLSATINLQSQQKQWKELRQWEHIGQCSVAIASDWESVYIIFLYHVPATC